MPESVIYCIDNSDPTRNGDYTPSRLGAFQETATYLAKKKSSENPENMVGFLTMGGHSVNVIESLTAASEPEARRSRMERLTSSMNSLAIGGRLHFSTALRIARMALSINTGRHEKRIVAFVGSPVGEEDKVLEKLGKKLRKEDIAVDVVVIGEEDGNADRLNTFISAVNKADNSHILVVPRGEPVKEHTRSCAIGGGSGDHGGGGIPGMDDDMDYGNVDPDMAAALRASLETAGATNAGGGATGIAPTLAPSGAQQESIEEEDPDLAAALRLSLMEEEERQRAAAAASSGPVAGNGTGGPAGGVPAPPPQPSEAQQFDQLVGDPAFLAQLEEQLNNPTDNTASTNNNNNNENKSEGDKKPDEDKK